MIKYKGESRVTDDDIDLSSFLKELGQYRWYFVGAFGAAVIAALLYIQFTLPVYEASASILIRESNQPAMNMEDILTGDLFGDQANIATERGVLASRSVMKETISQLGLQVSMFNTSVLPNKPLYRNVPFIVIPDSINGQPRMVYDAPFSVNIVEGGKFTLSIEAEDDVNGDYQYTGEHAFGEKITTPRFSLTLIKPADTVSIESAEFEFVVHSIESKVNEMLSRLKIDAPDKDATIVKLSFQDNIPESGG
jgi:tyrosine-protein kinase Etk/Wzc